MPAEYKRLQKFATLCVQREIRYERVKRIRRFDGSPSGILCVDCGGVAVAYDHRDYFEPTVIEPVCAKCNARRGPATRTLERLCAGEKFQDSRDLFELTPRALRNQGQEV